MDWQWIARGPFFLPEAIKKSLFGIIDIKMELIPRLLFIMLEKGSMNGVKLKPTLIVVEQVVHYLR
jgi:hypothetical protein